jgi:hypothetical protein
MRVLSGIPVGRSAPARGPQARPLAGSHWQAATAGRPVAVTEARCEILDLLSQGLDAKVVPDHCRIRF